MTTINIDHPLRRISYQVKREGYTIPSETEALENYRLAHDQVWRMKHLFEQEKGEVQLTLIHLQKLHEEYHELNHIFDHYKKEIDFSSKSLATELEVNFQVELRDFYNSVLQQQHKMVRFYDIIGLRDAEYTMIKDTYFRGEKPIDPLHFKVLDQIFIHHTDMQVDVISLDKDLQQFLAVLSDVYRILDDYIQQYNKLYNSYSAILQKASLMTKEVQTLQVIWGG